MPELTHVDAAGDAHMVDVGGKPLTERVAVAEGQITLSPEGYAAVVERRAAKGDVLTIAQIAGIQGAKRAADLIPLCHPLPLSGVDVELSLRAGCVVHCRATARAHWRTGVEMEALSAVSAALLTVYDMLKAIDRGMEISGVRLVEKRGGRSGPWSRPGGTGA
jgi:cyclic pyranopterin phosphate synthase